MMVNAHFPAVNALSTLFEGFMLAKEAEGVKDTTLETYRVMFRTLQEHLPEEKLLHADAVTPQDMQRFVVSIKDYAAATRDQRISKTKVFFKWCHDNGYMDHNPTTILKRPKKTWQPDPFSETELHFLLEEAKKGPNGVRNYAIVCILLDTGIRNTELRSLLVEDVNLKAGQIFIREGKGSKSRTVLMGKRSKDALWRWIMARPDDSPWLFPAAKTGTKIDAVKSERMWPNSLSRLINKIGRRAGVHAYPHRFRHTFALEYLKMGGDPYSLQFLLGHEDMVTVKEYVKVAAANVRDLYKSPLDAL